MFLNTVSLPQPMMSGTKSINSDSNIDAQIKQLTKQISVLAKQIKDRDKEMTKEEKNMLQDMNSHG